MYGDTTTIRRLASQMRERADEIRAEAAHLAARADQVDWEGLAADAMRRLAHDRTAALRRTAALHDDAAEALDRHAREVDRVKDLIAAVEHRVRRLLAEAVGGLGGLLHHFSPPPSGSREWLTVELPGWLR
jgi:uncharacterized protein YukE